MSSTSENKISLITVAANPDQFINSPLAENILKEKQASYALFSMMLGDWLTAQGYRAPQIGDYSIMNMLERECKKQRGGSSTPTPTPTPSPTTTQHQ